MPKVAVLIYERHMILGTDYSELKILTISEDPLAYYIIDAGQAIIKNTLK